MRNEGGKITEKWERHRSALRNHHASMELMFWKYSRLGHSTLLDSYHESKGCKRVKGKKRKQGCCVAVHHNHFAILNSSTVQNINTGDEVDYITKVNKGNCSVCLEVCFLL